MAFVCLSVHLCVCFFPDDISKTAAYAARITKLDKEMFHHDSWLPTYFGVKVKATRHKNTVPKWIVALL